MGTPTTGALNARGVGKSCNLSDQYLAIARKRLKIVGDNDCSITT